MIVPYLTQQLSVLRLTSKKPGTADHTRGFMKVIRGLLDRAMNWGTFVVSVFWFGKERFTVTQYKILAGAVNITKDILCKSECLHQKSEYGRALYDLLTIQTSKMLYTSV